MSEFRRGYRGLKGDLPPVCGIALDELEKTISEAVEECIDNGILKEFLTSNKDEVINILCNEWLQKMAQEILDNEEVTDDEKIDIVARQVLTRFKPAFLDLAK